MKVGAQALRGPWRDRPRAYADSNALLPFLVASSSSKSKERDVTSRKATKTRATLDNLSLINLFTQDPLAPALTASTLTVSVTSLFTPTLVTPYISSTAVAVTTTTSEQNTFIPHPSTDFGTHTITRRPTTTSVPTSVSSSGPGPSVLSIALISAGGALLILLLFFLLRRCCTASRKRAQLEDIMKETPLFGGSRFGETIDAWPSIRGTGAQALERVPPSFIDRSRFSISKRAIGLNGAVNGWNVLGDYKEGNDHSGLAGVGARNMNQSQKSSPPLFTTGARMAPTIDDAAAAANEEHERPQRPGSFADPGRRGQSAWSISPESTYDAEINIASRSKASSPRIVNISSALTDHPTHNHSSVNTSGNTRPLTLRKSSVPAYDPSHSLHQSRFDTSDDIPLHRPVQSILKSQTHADPLDAGQVIARSKRIPRGKDSRNSSGTAKESIHVIDRALASTPKSLANKSRYTPSSGRPLAPVTSSYPQITSPSIVSDFPLPPASNTLSTFTSSTSLPYARPPHSQLKGALTTPAISYTLNSPSLLPYATPESPSLGLANMGDLMLNGFDDAVGADGGEGSPSLRRGIDSESKVESNVRNDVRITRIATTESTFDNLNSKFHPMTASVPSIMITTIPSADNFKALNRRLSRTAAQIQMKTPVSTEPDPLTSASRTLHDPEEWLPLSQMALERIQADYRSATYSVFGMYDDVGTSLPPGLPKSSSSTDTHEMVQPLGLAGDRKKRAPGVTTLSTIYSGYGLDRTDEDISASFAKEVGASLGRIGVI